MILTYKVRHDRDFSEELRKAKQVADHAVEHRTFTSKDVTHIGLKSMIANQILRKYGRSKTIKKARNVNLVVPGQGIKTDHTKKLINVLCLDLSLSYRFPDFDKANQIEVDDEYAYISVTVMEKEIVEPSHYIGVDLNATGHAAVVGDPVSGKVWKLGKQCQHVHTKYKNTRRRLQKKGKYRMVKKIKDRESRIVRYLNHKMSRKIVEIAKATGSGIKLEQLEGIRKNKKQAKSFRYSLNSWSFYQLRQFVEYKAKLQGIAVAYIEPAYTSKTCSKCGRIGNRNGKSFKCPTCGHVENADANASFNIAMRPIDVTRSDIERDMSEGSTDTPQTATLRTTATVEPHEL
jgi:putative transposase